MKSVARPSGTPTLWCTIYQAKGMHMREYYPRIVKYMHELKHPFCKFFSSLGHEKHHCRSFYLMIDRDEIYRMHAEPTSPSSPSRRGGFQTRGRERGGGVGQGRGKLICYNCGDMVCYVRNCPNPA